MKWQGWQGSSVNGPIYENPVHRKTLASLANTRRNKITPAPYFLPLLPLSTATTDQEHQ